jgi:hypothetical protein
MRFFLKYRFLLGASFIFTFAFLNVIVFNYFTGDFWWHLPEIQEFLIDFSSPKHPHFNFDSPTGLTSYYIIFLSIIAKIFSLDGKLVLSMGGLVNLIIFFFGGVRFARALIGDTLKMDFSYYFLIFSILLWSGYPWGYSGFLHVGVFFYNLSYPSFFAIGLSFFALATFINWNGELSIKNKEFLILLILNGLIASAHLPTFIFLFCWYLGFSVGKFKFFCLIFVLATLLIFALLLAELNPYTSSFLLKLKKINIFNFVHQDTYTNFWRNMWLILLISICSGTYLFYKRNKRLLAIAIAALSLLVIYIFGFIFNLGNLGRLISYFAISLHILIALAAVEFEKNLFENRVSKAFFSVIIVVVLIFNAQYHIRFLFHQITIKGNNFNKLLFLKDFVHRYDIVLADENNTIFIPSISGKVFTLFLNTNVSQNEFELAELKRNQFF